MTVNAAIVKLIKHLAKEHPEMPISKAMRLINKFMEVHNEQQ